MKKIIILSFLVLLFPVSLCAKLRVVATYQYIASLVREIGGDLVDVNSLSNGNIDPHTVVPRPSFIAKASRADLLIINGASLDEAWMAPIISQSGNPAIRKGAAGFLDLSSFVRLRETPVAISREYGDVHPDGNPHFHLDPFNIPVLARAIREKLAKLDPKNALLYSEREKTFIGRWKKKNDEWSAVIKSGTIGKIIQYHNLFNYFFRRYSVENAGFIEPLPGIPPSSKYIAALVKTARAERVALIIQDVYHSDEAARYIARETGARVVVLPHDVGSVKGSEDIFSLFDEIVRRLTK